MAVRPNLYYLDIDLPFTVDANESGAQFDKETHVCDTRLCITLSSCNAQMCRLCIIILVYNRNYILKTGKDRVLFVVYMMDIPL